MLKKFTLILLPLFFLISCVSTSNIPQSFYDEKTVSKDNVRLIFDTTPGASGSRGPNSGRLYQPQGGCQRVQQQPRNSQQAFYGKGSQSSYNYQPNYRQNNTENGSGKHGSNGGNSNYKGNRGGSGSGQRNKGGNSYGNGGNNNNNANALNYMRSSCLIFNTYIIYDAIIIIIIIMLH